MNFNEIIKKLHYIIIDKMYNVIKKMNLYVGIFFFITVIFIFNLKELSSAFKIIMMFISFIFFDKIDKYVKIRKERKNIFIEIKKLDDNNQEIFNESNPFSESFLENPSDEKIKKWKDMREKIKLNNKKILDFLNNELLIIPKKDKKIIEKYKLHLIQYNSFQENKFRSDYYHYPKEIKKIIKKYSGE